MNIIIADTAHGMAWPEAADLAAYVIQVDRALAGQDSALICSGSIFFPEPKAG